MVLTIQTNYKNKKGEGGLGELESFSIGQKWDENSGSDCNTQKYEAHLGQIKKTSVSEPRAHEETGSECHKENNNTRLDTCCNKRIADKDGGCNAKALNSDNLPANNNKRYCNRQHEKPYDCLLGDAVLGKKGS